MTGYLGAADVQTAVDQIVRHLKALEAAVGTGSSIAIGYTFSTTTTDADPGSGTIRLSNGTQYLSVTLRADLLDANPMDVTAQLDAIDATAYLRLEHRTDPSKWLEFSVSAIASPSGYRNITIANVAKSSSSPFTNGDSVVLVIAHRAPASWRTWHPADAPRRWEPVTTNPGGGPELVFDGDDIVMNWTEY